MNRAQTPAMVAQRLTDLLMQFPAVAICGVQWRVLVEKFEKKHSTRLDMHALGFSCALVAATTLLWDVVRVVDKEDVDNPIIAVEDTVCMTPRPGFIATWPSLYKTLCDLVHDNGSENIAPPEAGVGARGLLVSQLKPLMQSCWHANFDEHDLGFLSEEGSWVKVKKMKHLLTGVLRWRDQRIEWSVESKVKLSKIDEVLQTRLQLIASKKHNDLVLVSALDDINIEAGMTGKIEGNQVEKVDFRLPEMFDDPYEPPPQKQWAAWGSTTSTNCCTPSLSHSDSMSLDRSDSCRSLGAVIMSGSSTPSMSGRHEPSMNAPTFGWVPVWMSASAIFGDRGNIETGMVQRLAAQIEHRASGMNAAPLVPPFRRG